MTRRCVYRPRSCVMALGVLLCASSTLRAQQGGGSRPQPLRDTTAAVRGTVVDSAGRALEGVEVRAVTSGASARTSDTGRFGIAALPAGRARFLVRRPGLRPIDTSVVLMPNIVVELSFVMRRLPSILDTLRVVAAADCPTRTLEGFECRRRVGLGAFRDSAELAALGATEMTDLAWGITGIRVQQTGLGRLLESTAGWRCLITMLDGKLPVQGDGMHMLTPDRVIALEYFAEQRDVPEWYRSDARLPMVPGRRPRENPRPSNGRAGGGGYTPGTPAMPGRNCSLLVLWTKQAPRFDPRRDQSDRVREARKRRLLLDSLMSRADMSPVR